ncbi:MAG: phage terminase large subunit [Sphingosinicella sp.]|uniref:phage terminase large subunit n=1 Tax=Sphingosinicella sp. TaxID=1917971 RepID=UPI00403830AE
MSNPVELQGAIDGLARGDLRTFMTNAMPILNGVDLEPNWHLDVLACAFGRIAEPDPLRMIVAIPPRHCKTFVGSICATAWLLGRDPKAQIICISYGADLAEKFSADTKRLMESPWYRRVFPGTVITRATRNEIKTSAGGTRLATSVGGTLTGRGADVIIADDLLNSGHAHSVTMRDSTYEWFTSSVLTRFNTPKAGKLIVIGQRLHAEDPPGRLIEAGGYETIIIPAIAKREMSFEMVRGGIKGVIKPGRILMESRQGKAELDQLRHEMGERDFEAQYNQEPLPPGGTTFKAGWLKRYAEPPDPARIRSIFQCWDTAYESSEDNSYSACTTWALVDDKFYLIDVWRARPAFYQLERKVYDLRKKWKAKLVIVEKAASGRSLIHNIWQRDGHKWLHWLSPAAPKLERAEQQQPKFEQGRIFLPEKADWLADYEAELLRFPHSKRNDQVDSTVNFLTAWDMGGLLHRADLYG